jgi:adenylate kinase
MTHSQLLAIGGRSGVGKSTVAFAIHDLLSGQGVQHAVIEGDALDLAHPAPWESRMAARNLRAVWANYRSEGYRRLVYTNTVSVLEVDDLAAAMGDDPFVTAVLLEARDESVEARLRQREQGDSLKAHLERSKRSSAFLASKAPSNVYRVVTDSKSPSSIASEIGELLAW